MSAVGICAVLAYAGDDTQMEVAAEILDRAAELGVRVGHVDVALDPRMATVAARRMLSRQRQAPDVEAVQPPRRHHQRKVRRHEADEQGPGLGVRPAPALGQPRDRPVGHALVVGVVGAVPGPQGVEEVHRTACGRHRFAHRAPDLADAAGNVQRVVLGREAGVAHRVAFFPDTVPHAASRFLEIRCAAPYLRYLGQASISPSRTRPWTSVRR